MAAGTKMAASTKSAAGTKIIAGTKVAEGTNLPIGPRRQSVACLATGACLTTKVWDRTGIDPWIWSQTRICSHTRRRLRYAAQLI